MAIHQSWTWKDGDGRSGVNVEGDKIVWWNTPGGPGGRFAESAREQTIQSFMEKGPEVAAPAEILEKLRVFLTHS
ncbi:MAG: hypothetical protein J0L75_11605 [Spirochaetes bacterium]|nr:hypothetical protein [Spirochaetota bacterium]